MGDKKKSKKIIPLLPIEIIMGIMLKLPVISLLRCKEDQLSAKHQLAVKGLREQHRTYSSQRHCQGSRRLLEDILVNWDG
ncbi:hypothetical protein Tco_0962597 [Tanacetum coccineum]